jgi:hypothetical protein
MINYEEVARDLYALGSWPIVGILIATLAFLRNTSLIIEVIIALGIAFIITTLLNPDERIVRMIIVLTTVGLLAGTVRGWIITAIIAAAALTLSARYLNRYDVTRSALIGVLVQGLAFFVVSFI